MSIVLTCVTDELLSIFDSATRVAVLTGVGVSSLPIAAKQPGVRLVEVNPEQTDISLMCEVTLLGKAAEILPQFLKERG